MVVATATHASLITPHLFHHASANASLSRPPASPLVARPRVSSSPTRLPASPHPRPVVSRSPIVISPVPSLSVRSVATRSRPSSSSGSSPSSVSSVRLPRTSSRTSASRALPSARSRSPSRLTSSPCSRTPTFGMLPRLAFHRALEFVLTFLLQRHPRQACHHPEQGHPARPPSPWRALVICFLLRCNLDGTSRRLDRDVVISGRVYSSSWSTDVDPNIKRGVPFRRGKG